MLTASVPVRQGPKAEYNLLETLNFKFYEALPRIVPYQPNALFMSHVSRPYTGIAWHSDYRVQFPHSAQYRMLRAISADDLQEVATLLKRSDFMIDEPIESKYGYNALQLASLINQFTVVEMLLMHGANINKKDRYGNSALMYAIDRHNLQTVNSLMKNGADRNESNNFGVTPLLKAKSKAGQEYLAEFLENYPETKRRFPKFHVKLGLEGMVNASFWNMLLKFKVYGSKPKLLPFNNLKGTYKIDLSPYKTVDRILSGKRRQH